MFSKVVKYYFCMKFMEFKLCVSFVQHAVSFVPTRRGGKNKNAPPTFTQIILELELELDLSQDYKLNSI